MFIMYFNLLDQGLRRVSLESECIWLPWSREITGKKIAETKGKARKRAYPHWHLTYHGLETGDLLSLAPQRNFTSTMPCSQPIER